jgi:hypothetical protein
MGLSGFNAIADRAPGEIYSGLPSGKAVIRGVDIVAIDSPTIGVYSLRVLFQLLMYELMGTAASVQGCRKLAG